MNATDNNNVKASVFCCDSCGVAESDEIKLKKCAACKSVRYCGVTCQKNHRRQHKKACNKRAVELREEILFRQPEGSHCGDCPICFLPLPLALDVKNNYSLYTCCCKMICKGCGVANDIRQEEEGLNPKCPFCPERLPETDEEVEENFMKRAAANDPLALREIGNHHEKEEDYDSAFKYWTRAAELGDVVAHYNLSISYQKGLGVEKDEERKIYHLEEAAIAGQPDARHDLACLEWDNARFYLECDEDQRGGYDRAVKHWIIAANLGHDKSAKELKECYIDGRISKDDFAAALRAHQAAKDAMKSPQREAAAESH